MATVPQGRTPSKAFYAVLFEDQGVIAKVDGTIYFMHSTTGELLELEPPMCNFLTVLGQVGLADTQQLMDRLHGGYAGVCTSRQMEVA